MYFVRAILIAVCLAAYGGSRLSGTAADGKDVEGDGVWTAVKELPEEAVLEEVWKHPLPLKENRKLCRYLGKEPALENGCEGAGEDEYVYWDFNEDGNRDYLIRCGSAAAGGMEAWKLLIKEDGGKLRERYLPDLKEAPLLLNCGGRDTKDMAVPVKKGEEIYYILLGLTTEADGTERYAAKNWLQLPVRRESGPQAQEGSGEYPDLKLYVWQDDGRLLFSQKGDWKGFQVEQLSDSLLGIHKSGGTGVWFDLYCDTASGRTTEWYQNVLDSRDGLILYYEAVTDQRFTLVVRDPFSEKEFCRKFQIAFDMTGWADPSLAITAEFKEASRIEVTYVADPVSGEMKTQLLSFDRAAK